jgi:ketosteroid isomerase-like protein
MTTHELQGSSVWAFERQSYEIELTPREGGSPVADRGSSVWIWQRQSDGGWRVARAIWNSNVPLPAGDTDADARAIRKVADEYTTACNTGNLDALMATCTPDVVFLPPDDNAVSGAAQSRQWLKTTFFDPFNVLLSFSIAELDVRGDRAVAYGPFRLTLTPRDGGAAIHDAGKFIDVYHRQGDGSWKFGRVIFNRDAPATGSPA